MPHVQLFSLYSSGQPVQHPEILTDLLTHGDKIRLWINYPVLPNITRSPEELRRRIHEYFGADFVVLAPTTREESPKYRQAQLIALAKAAEQGWPAVPIRFNPYHKRTNPLWKSRRNCGGDSRCGWVVWR